MRSRAIRKSGIRRSAACATRRRFGTSYWDAAILEASRALGCDVVLSEDLCDGQDYAGVPVENPFKPAGR
jgi:predicted nucleic acid-binding protein